MLCVQILDIKHKMTQTKNVYKTENLFATTYKNIQ